MWAYEYVNITLFIHFVHSLIYLFIYWITLIFSYRDIVCFTFCFSFSNMLSLVSWVFMIASIHRSFWFHEWNSIDSHRYVKSVAVIWATRKNEKKNKNKIHIIPCMIYTPIGSIYVCKACLATVPITRLQMHAFWLCMFTSICVLIYLHMRRRYW